MNTIKQNNKHGDLLEPVQENVEQRSREGNSRLNDSRVSHHSRASYRQKHKQEAKQDDLVGEEVKQTTIKPGHHANKPSYGMSSVDSEYPSQILMER
jgi:hypothetical protein